MLPEFLQVEAFTKLSNAVVKVRFNCRTVGNFCLLLCTLATHTSGLITYRGALLVRFIACVTDSNCGVNYVLIVLLRLLKHSQTCPWWELLVFMWLFLLSFCGCMWTGFIMSTKSW